MTDEERANLTAILTDVKQHLAKEIHNLRAYQAAGLPLDVRFALPGSEAHLEPPSQAAVENMVYAVGYLATYLEQPEASVSSPQLLRESKAG